MASTSAEYRRTFTSLVLLVIILLKQTRIRLAFLDTSAKLDYAQPAFDKHPQAFFCWAAFQPLFPQPVALDGVVVTHVQDLELHLIKPNPRLGSLALSYYSSLSRSLCKAFIPSSRSTLPHNLMSYKNSSWVHLIPSSKSIFLHNMLLNIRKITETGN